MHPDEVKDFTYRDVKETALAVLRGDIDFEVPTPEENAIQELLDVKVISGF